MKDGDKEQEKMRATEWSRMPERQEMTKGTSDAACFISWARFNRIFHVQSASCAHYRCTGGIFVLSYFYRTVFLSGNTDWLNISTCSSREVERGKHNPTQQENKIGRFSFPSISVSKVGQSLDRLCCSLKQNNCFCNFTSASWKTVSQSHIKRGQQQPEICWILLSHHHSYQHDQHHSHWSSDDYKLWKGPDNYPQSVLRFTKENHAR